MLKIKNIINYNPDVIKENEKVNIEQDPDIAKLKHKEKVFDIITLSMLGAIIVCAIVTSTIIFLNSEKLKSALFLGGVITAVFVVASYIPRIGGDIAWEHRKVLKDLKTADIVFHHFVNGKNISNCFITTICDSDCMVRVITEDSSGISEDEIRFAYKPSDNVKEVTLDVGKRTVFYPETSTLW